MKVEIIHSECREYMRTMPDNIIDCVLTDPPYGLAFMGKKWDYQLPSIDIWKELLRICKPGAPMLCCGGTRTYHRLTCLIEDAGWQIKDCLMFLYGTGFPKSNNFGRKLNDEWNGYGTALKPAYEPILLCMKPNDGTFAQNAQKWGVAGINIDDCRIAAFKGDYEHAGSDKIKSPTKGIYGNFQSENSVAQAKPSPLGRWPANIILDEESAQLLDEQSGISKSQSGGNVGKNHASHLSGISFIQRTRHDDSGGASRFFYCAKASSSERNKGCERLQINQTIGDGGTNNTEDDVCGKYSSIKRPAQNFHPTVKPQKLLQYLLKLIMPPNPNAIVLDPFVGSGSTLVAAKDLGYNAIGIEKEAEYVEIAKARVNYGCD